MCCTALFLCQVFQWGWRRGVSKMTVSPTARHGAGVLDVRRAPVRPFRAQRLTVRAHLSIFSALPGCFTASPLLFRRLSLLSHHLPVPYTRAPLLRNSGACPVDPIDPTTAIPANSFAPPAACFNAQVRGCLPPPFTALSLSFHCPSTVLQLTHLHRPPHA